ncbi:MAG TPA: hypothetical protein VFR58_18705 [Flavisolibacter sp.]|nr:hypothetical protein [Flavisolibacter sp.]
MENTKIDFLKHRFTALLRKLPSDTRAQWGKMTLQQMIEHFSDSVRISSGKTPFTDIMTPPEHLEKLRAFILSDKPFRENTTNPLMSEVPAPVRTPSVKDAIIELEKELAYFFAVFEKNKLQVTRSPHFGDFNFEQNVHLLHKHARHHLRQFGLDV